MSDLDNLLQDNDNDSDLVRDLRKQLRDKTKAEKELVTRVQEYEKKSRTTSIADVLKSKGVNPKVAAFIPTDVDATEEAVSSWLTEYGDVFGVQPQAETPPSGEQAPNQGADPAAIAALARAQQTGHEGAAPSLSSLTLDKLQKATEGATSMDEITSRLNEALSKR